MKWRIFVGLFKKHPSIPVGFVVTLVFLGLWLIRFSLFSALDLKLYDLAMGLKTDPDSAADIVMVDIDDDSIDKLGRWPWPRSRIASGIDKIHAGNPGIIGLNLILSEPEQTDGLKLLSELEREFDHMSIGFKDPAHTEFAQKLKHAKDNLDNDRKLAQAIKTSGRVLLPVFFKEGMVALDQVVTDEALIRQSIGQVKTSPHAQYPRASDIILPILPFFENALGIGHINLTPDMDGVVRQEQLFYEYKGIYIPSFSLRLAGFYLNIPVDRIRADLGEAVFLGKVRVPITNASAMMVGFKGPSGAFKHYSFFDVINDKVNPSVFKGKIVLINPTATGILNPLSTPVDAVMHVGEFSANAVWTLLNGAFIRQPSWASHTELAMLICLGFVITFVMGARKPWFQH